MLILNKNILKSATYEKHRARRQTQILTSAIQNRFREIIKWG
jgi:hypothetical protein